MKVLVSPSFSQTGFQIIKSTLDDFDVSKPQSWEPDPEAQALIIRSKDKVDESFSGLFPQLKIIVSATAGFDHIDFPLEGVHLCYCPEANAQSAAELTLFHILHFLKKGTHILNPNQWREPHMLSSELAHQKISLIGLGRIGSRLAQTLKALGCHQLFAYDPYQEQEHFDDLAIERVGFTEALRLADIVSLHCPLTRKTRGMINETALDEMNSHALLVNCARGEMVHTHSLLKSLKLKKIAGACLDVFENEPLIGNSEVRNHSGIQWSPHIGAYTEQAQKRSALEAAQQIKSWFNADHDVLHSVPPQVDWAADL